MFVLPFPITRINFILLLLFVVITNIDCRLGGRGRLGRVRMPNFMRNKPHSNNMKGSSSILRKPNNHMLVRGAVGGGSAVLLGTLALQTYVLNNNKESIQSRRRLTNGTGSICLNKKNYSNFIFNEFRCPLSPIYPANYRYCCGSFSEQYCCSFWASNSRGIGAIIGIVSACCLFFLFIICCIVYYRRHLRRKAGIREQINMESPVNYIPTDAPPSYSEAVKRLTKS